MNSRRALSVAFVGLMSLWPLQTKGDAQTQGKPSCSSPSPGYRRSSRWRASSSGPAYNNEAYVILGYQATNRSVGDEWMLLEVGMTVLDNTPDYKLTRAAISLETPDGKTIPLPPIAEQRAGNVQAIQQRATVQRDNINYFPLRANRPCALLFFPDLGARALPFDEVELSRDRACVGRLYFRIPGGITYGQHWLNVKFQNSVLRVPFRILTKEEEQFFEKNYKAIDKQVEEAFRPKK